MENGNRKTKTQGGATTTYRWDGQDRLIEVLRDGTWLAQYDYDANGVRIEKTVRGSPNSTLTRFQYDGNRLQSEANALNNTLVTYYRDDNGKLLGLRRNGEYRSVISDGQGTPIAILSPEGAVLGRFIYDPWGGLLRSTGPDSIPIRYTGYYFDEETDLYYAGARYYDPAIGGFISRDPIDGDVERPITQNKYIAFNANPGVYQDPNGHCGLATGDTSECINNVAAAEGWSTDQWQEELGIQSAAEDRSAPGKLLGMAATMTGLGLSRAIGAGIQAFRQFRHFGYAAAVVANQGAPHVEQALELASGVPGPGASTVPTLGGRVASAEAASARTASAAMAFDDVPLPPGVANAADDFPARVNSSSATATVVQEGSDGRQLLGTPGNPAQRSEDALGFQQPVPGPSNFMGDQERFFKNAMNGRDIDAGGRFDVVAHGEADKIQVMTSSGILKVDPRAVATLIKKNPDYTGGPVRLLSCSTGECPTGFAQHLANKLGVKVDAPSDLLWAYPSGRLVVAPRLSDDPSSPLFQMPDLARQGEFRSFTPGKTQ